MPTITAQEQLFRQIRERLPEGRSLADTLTELLHLSYDSAYRRIRGETALVLEEARILCDHFHLSLDSLLHHREGSVAFTPVMISQTGLSFHDYLQGIWNSLQAVAAHRQRELIYVCKEMLPFYNFGYRPLFAFRYFFWMKSIVQHPDFARRTFSPDCLPPEVEAIGQSILRLYNDIPSTEIWNTECINSWINQIAYYREAGYIRTEADVEALHAALADLMAHLRVQADKGVKFFPGESPEARPAHLRLFFNSLVLADNTVLALVDGRRVLYLNYDVLNYLSTQDEAFTADVHDKLQALMRRSTLISQVSEKQRAQFFGLINRRIPGYDWYRLKEVS